MPNGSSSCAPRCPSPAVRRERLRADWGISEFDMASVINAGALDLVVATIEAGRITPGPGEVVAR